MCTKLLLELVLLGFVGCGLTRFGVACFRFRVESLLLFLNFVLFLLRGELDFRSSNVDFI